MNKTEFLLRLKLQKGLSYLKILQVMQQMPPDEDVDHEWLNCLELPDEISNDFADFGKIFSVSKREPPQ